MYEWVKEVDKLIQSLSGEINNWDTRTEVTKNIISILDKHEVKAFVDCSTNVNTTEVVHHGEFRAKVELPTLVLIFKFIRKVKS